MQHKSVATILTANVTENTKKALISPCAELFIFKNHTLKALCIIAAISVFSALFMFAFERNKKVYCNVRLNLLDYYFRVEYKIYVFDVPIEERSAGSLLINSQSNENDLFYITYHLPLPFRVKKNDDVDVMDRFRYEYTFTAVVPR